MSYKKLYLQDTGRILKLTEKSTPCGRVFGVPFDSTSTYRPGSKFAPNTIREAFNNIEIYSRTFNIDLEKEYIEDLGDMIVPFNMEECLDQISKISNELLTENITFCMLGGEHTISYGTIKVLPKDVGIIIFDAHLDLRDEMNGSKFTHATFYRRLLEKIDKERFLHIGARAACAEEWKLIEKERLNVIEASKFNVKFALENEFFKKYRRVYLSIDVDFFDPSFAPGVGNPEPFGLSPQNFIELLANLKDIEIVGFDIVEVCPPYDNGNTSILAAKLMLEIFSYCIREKTS
ncbi:MAG: agmatinase [Nitrososphaeria archaeon]|nr:agmatinase [Nitrososphaeria archaeon]